jgi:hypothetical protein
MNLGTQAQPSSQDMQNPPIPQESGKVAGSALHIGNDSIGFGDTI